MSDFLRRWSRRKVEASRDVSALEIPAEMASATGADSAGAASLDDPSAEEQAALAQKLAALPALEESDAATDIRPFLQDFVPAALRKAAMRRAWAMDPIISTHFDVARDYAWEFNVGEGPAGFYKNLGHAAVQRGLDALREAGPAPVEVSVDEETGPVAAPELSPATAQIGREAATDDADARHVDPHGDTPPALHLPQKHGSALPG